MPLDELVGHILDGRYKVLEPISEGAMGVVYRGERLKLGRPVAIKVMRDELPNELASRKRFEVEAKAMARLEHPHCVSVLDVGLHEDKPYVVMDFISGTNLREMLDKGRLDIARAVEMMRQILSGLGHAHELGIMHRDIKPANIMVSKKTGIGDQVKILDFGLARLDHDSQLTGTMVLGTPAYMAPEQCTGGAIDFRTDLYACGVLLFEMLAGHKPFHSEKDDPIEVVRMHIDNPPPRLDAKAPGMDFGELEDVVARALAKSPDERFQTAAEFAAALDAAAAPFRTSGAIAVPPSGPIAVPVAPATRTGSTQVGAGAPPRKETVDAKFGAQVQSAPAVASSPPQGLDAKFGSKHKEPSFDPSWSWPSSEESSMPTDKAKKTAEPKVPKPKTSRSKSTAKPAESTEADAKPASKLAEMARAAESKAAEAKLPPEPEPKASPLDALVSPAASSESLPSAVLALESRPDKSPSKFESDAKPKPEARAPRDQAASDPIAAFREPAAQAEDEAQLAMTPDPGPRLRRRKMLMIGGAAAGGIVLIAIIATRGGSSTTPERHDKPAMPDKVDKPVETPTKPPDRPAVKPADTPPAPVEDGPQKVISDATALIGEGKQDAALARIATGRKQYFANPDLPYFAGRIQFSRQHYTEGLAALRDAIKLDDSFRANPELIQLVVDGFTSTKDRNAQIAAFLHDVIGDAAVPVLDRVTREHPNPAMRERASKELAHYKK